MFRRIMAAWDGSDVAERVVRTAHDLAAHYGAHLTVVSVLEVPVHAEAREDRDQAAREQTDHYAEALVRLGQGSAEMPMALQHEFVEGTDAAHTLCAYAREHEYDLIVIGRGPRGIIQRMFSRDVTEAVARDAPCSVLVVCRPL